MKIKDIQLDNRNANKGTARGQKQIVGSIQRNGFGRSGLLDKNGKAIAGNKTTEAAAEVFGVETEPIIVKTDGQRPVYVQRTDLDLDDPDPNNAARRLAYEDNLASHFSFQLDPAIVMADIEAGFNFEAIDITLPDLGDMLEGAARELLRGNGQGQPEPPTPTETEAERLAKEYGVKPGQVWQLGRHRIACIDSTDEAAVKELIGGQRVGFVWADPPYGLSAVVPDGTVGYSYYPKGVYGQLANKNTYAPIVGDDTPETATKAFTICQTMREAMQVWWGGNYYAHLLPPSRCWVIWDKQTDGNEFADCEIAWTNATGRTRLFRHTWNGMIKASERGEKRVHPTQKPVALVEWCFSNYGHTEDLIFDPFLGSGISILAAERLNDGRRVIGCELAPEYIGVTIHRWATLTGQTPKLSTDSTL